MAMNNKIAPAAALALNLFFTAAACIAALVVAVPPATAETLTKRQSDALAAYNNSKSQFEQVLTQRRAPVSSANAVQL